MANNYEDIMALKTDEQLIKITTISRSDYQSEALQAADEELYKRGIDEEIIENIKVSQKNQIESENAIDSNKVNLGARFIHFVIDLIAILIIHVIIINAIHAFILLIDLTINSNTYLTFVKVVSLLSLSLSFFSYYIIMETKYQKTVGKMITNSKVVTIDGQKPTLREITIRTLCRLIPFDRLSFLFIKNGIHDMLSDTIVIKDNSNIEYEILDK